MALQKGSLSELSIVKKTTTFKLTAFFSKLVLQNYISSFLSMSLEKRKKAKNAIKPLLA